MVYNPNIPTAPQKLSVSQPLILGNFQQLDTSFGIDHYKYSDATANNGFHNQVTTPNHSTAADPATVANPVLYALEKTGNIGSLQYSRGPNDAVPTPVTSLHSPSTPLNIPGSGTTVVLNFTGMSVCFAELFYSYSYLNPGIIYNSALYYVYYSSTSAAVKLIPIYNNNIAISQAIFTGSTLQIKSILSFAFSDVYWTLKLNRVQV